MLSWQEQPSPTSATLTAWCPLLKQAQTTGNLDIQNKQSCACASPRGVVAEESSHADCRSLLLSRGLHSSGSPLLSLKGGRTMKAGKQGSLWVDLNIHRVHMNIDCAQRQLGWRQHPIIYLLAWPAILCIIHTTTLFADSSAVVPLPWAVLAKPRLGRDTTKPARAEWMYLSGRRGRSAFHVRGVQGKQVSLSGLIA